MKQSLVNDLGEQERVVRQPVVEERVVDRPMEEKED